LKGLLKGFKLALRPWESLKNWWRYDRMKFVTMVMNSALMVDSDTDICFLEPHEIAPPFNNTAKLEIDFLSMQSPP